MLMMKAPRNTVPPAIGRLHVGNDARMLERRVVAWPVSQQHDVIVAVDHAGNHHAPSRVDRVRPRGAEAAAPQRRGTDVQAYTT